MAGMAANDEKSDKFFFQSEHIQYAIEALREAGCYL